MSFENLPDTLSEPPRTSAREIERMVTNGLGYNTKTDFYSHFYSLEELKNTEKGLQAHLAHLEMNAQIPSIRSTYWVLDNAPRNYKFTIRERRHRLFSPVQERVVSITLNPEERSRERKRLGLLAKNLKQAYQSAKLDAEYPSITDISRKIPHDIVKLMTEAIAGLADQSEPGMLALVRSDISQSIPKLKV